jgi:hypothetical protein
MAPGNEFKILHSIVNDPSDEYEKVWTAMGLSSDEVARLREKIGVVFLNSCSEDRSDGHLTSSFTANELFLIGAAYGHLPERANMSSAERRAALAETRKTHSWIARLPVMEQQVAAQRTMLHVDRAFRFLELILPRRISSEEIGDALEVMAEHFKRSPARWPAYVKLVTTIIFIVINTVRYFIACWKGEKKAGSRD